FRAVDEKWTGARRELRAVDLHEISIVSAWPAYSNTVVEARSRRSCDAPDAGLRRALERWRA
ncbi:MAG: HK97 family phage prohead protease, partial [Alphaproteobacteria bacterium]|nr:HK97 family phage prohead protease [Alphaproteobacteria bacterium]